MESLFMELEGGREVGGDRLVLGGDTTEASTGLDRLLVILVVVLRK